MSITSLFGKQRRNESAEKCGKNTSSPLWRTQQADVFTSLSRYNREEKKMRRRNQTSVCLFCCNLEALKSLLQFAKTCHPISVCAERNVACLNARHPTNASWSISIKEAGKVISRSEIQSLNAPEPMRFTPSSMMICRRLVQSKKERNEILLTLPGIWIVSKPMQ